ncbi:MAG: DUF397 domain-containing protein [Pseudonocardiaceae bacterium]
MEKRSVWRKSSYSTFEGNCVEFADLDHGGYAVRDSKEPAGPVLSCSPVQWAAFTAGVRAGDFG